MKHIIVALVLLTSMQVLFASPRKSVNKKQKFIDAEYFFLNEDYEKAVVLYNAQYAEDSANCNLAYRIGLCYLHIPLKLLQSIPYLEAATQNVNVDYKEGSYREYGSSVDVYFYLGYAFQMSQAFDKAIENYDFYQQHAQVSDLEFIDLAKRNIAACSRAKNLYSKQRLVEISNLGRTVNSQFADFNPCVTQDDSLLIYTVKTKKNMGRGEYTGFQYKIFSSRHRSEEKWTHPTDITNQLQTNSSAQIVSLSSNGKMMFLYRDDYYYGSINDISGGNIYYSQLVDGKWQAMKRFDAINSSFDETHASISDDGKSIFFTSNRKGGFGGLDIYRIDKLQNDKWTEPKNLGPNINTAEDEVAPFIINDTLLYFCSEGHQNIGGFDVFVSKKDINEQWSMPVNMGVPINSPGDETFFMPTRNGTTGYISMVRPDGYLTFGSNDIYSIAMLNDKGINTEINPPKLLTIDLMPNNSNDVLDSLTIKLISTAHQEILMPEIDYQENKMTCLVHPGNYILSIESKLYKPVSQTIYVPSDVRILPNMSVPINFYTNEYVRIANILFGEKNAIAAAQEIERMLILLRSNPSLYIEVIESKSSSKNVLHEQKQSIVDYLHEKGIEPMRFVSRNSNYACVGTAEGIQLRAVRIDSNATLNSELLFSENANKNHLRYSILLSKSKTKCDTSMFAKFYKQGLPRIFTRKYKSDYICYCGDFVTKAKALEMLNKAIDVGFADAQLIDFFKLNQLSDIMVVKTNPKARFTVQLGAYNVPCQDNFKSLGTVTEVYCSDGYYRYISGEFETIEAATTFCKKARSKAYCEAFVVSIEQFAKTFLLKTAGK